MVSLAHPERMAPLRLALFAAAAATLVVTSSAQVVFDPNIGSPLSLGNDSIAAGNVLGFSFEFPDGTSVTSVDIDSNGRVLRPNGGLSDPTESIAELLTAGSSICVLWDDLDPSDPGADDVYFHTYNDGSNDVAVITWKDVVKSGQSTTFTVQAVLRDDDSFSMWWSASTPAGEGLVGASAGSNGADPGVFDLDCGPLLSTQGEPTLYELFDGGSPFDLAGHGIDWLPFGGGVYAVSTPFSGTCVPPTPPTQARRTGIACGGIETPVAIDFKPDGTGGYNVTTSTNTYDGNVGGSLGIATDEGIAIAVLNFTFLMPGGTPVTALAVDANGRLIIGGLSDASPTMAEFLGAAGGVLAPAWGDFDVTNPASTGAIKFATNGTDYATVTWDHVAQFQGTIPLTFQIQLFGANHATNPNGWTVVFEDMAELDTNLGFGQGNWIVGCSAGGGAADPGEHDMTSLPIASASDPTVYEFFAHSVPEPWDLGPTSTPGLELAFSSLPRIGTNFDLGLSNIPAGASAAWMLIGFSNLELDLSVLGVPCDLYSSIAVPAQPMTWTVGSPTASYSLPITGMPGIPLVMQSVIVNLGANPLGLEFSNAVEGLSGN